MQKIDSPVKIVNLNNAKLANQLLSILDLTVKNTKKTKILSKIFKLS